MGVSERAEHRTRPQPRGRAVPHQCRLIFSAHAFLAEIANLVISSPWKKSTLVVLYKTRFGL